MVVNVSTNCNPGILPWTKMCTTVKTLVFASLLATTFSLTFPVLNENLSNQERWIPRSHYSNRISGSNESSFVSNFKVIHTAPVYKSSSQESINNPSNYLQYVQNDQSAFYNGGNRNSYNVHKSVPEDSSQESYIFNRKLGFSKLSSLLPTSILNLPQASSQEEATENPFSLQNDASNNDKSQRFSFLNSGLLQLPLRQSGQSNNALPLTTPSEHYSSAEQFDGTSQEVDSDSYSSGNRIFSRIRNLLPFGNGLLSGLLNPNGEMNNENEGFEDNAGDSGYGYSEAFQTSNDPPPPDAALFPNQMSVLNDGSSDGPEENDISNGSPSFLSSLPNPFTRVQNLLNNINFPPLDEMKWEEQQNALGFQEGQENDPLEDSTITPLESLSQGGLGGLLGVAVSSFSKLYAAFGVKFSLVKVAGIIIAPILAAAISAVVVGIVYLAVYIPAVAFQNEGLDGELYILNLRQLIDIVGLPDPLQDFIDNFRSLDGKRSAESFEVNKSRRIALNELIQENEQCFERLACEVIGRRFIGRRSWWKEGWVGKGIKWIGVNFKEREVEKIRSLEPFNWYIKHGNSMLQAVVTGMTSETEEAKKSAQSSGGRSRNINTTNDHFSTCLRYTCDPVQSVRKILNLRQFNVKS